MKRLGSIRVDVLSLVSGKESLNDTSNLPYSGRFPSRIKNRVSFTSYLPSLLITIVIYNMVHITVFLPSPPVLNECYQSMKIDEI